MRKTKQTAKLPSKPVYIRCGVSPEFHRVLEALLNAPPWNGTTVQTVLLDALLHYIPHDQWKRASAFVQVEPEELRKEGALRNSA